MKTSFHGNGRFCARSSKCEISLYVVITSVGLICTNAELEVFYSAPAFVTDIKERSLAQAPGEDREKVITMKLEGSPISRMPCAVMTG